MWDISISDEKSTYLEKYVNSFAKHLTLNNESPIIPIHKQRHLKLRSQKPQRMGVSGSLRSLKTKQVIDLIITIKLKNIT